MGLARTHAVVDDAVTTSFCYLIALHFHEFPCRASRCRRVVERPPPDSTVGREGRADRNRVKFTPVTRKSAALRH